MPARIQRPLNNNIVDHWPEIFSDVNLSAIPFYYLHSVVITFKNDDKWEFVIKKEDKLSSESEMPKNLLELFKNYKDDIANVDFRLDIEKIKRDVTKTTNKFLKRKK